MGSQRWAHIFRTRGLLVCQRTQLSNALRGHLGGFRFVVPQGVGQVGWLIDLAVDPATDLPDQAWPILAIIAEGIQALQAKITMLDREIIQPHDSFGVGEQHLDLLPLSPGGDVGLGLGDVAGEVHGVFVGGPGHFASRGVGAAAVLQ
jgi:hypothetical protein